MIRILLIAAMLLPVSSAMATVTITADVNTTSHDHDGTAHKTVTINYSSDVNVRAFALDINVDNGMNIGDSNLTGFLRGESVSPNTGYGIFPGRFRDFINASDPNWADLQYNPLTPWNSPGAESTGLGMPKMVVELGTLYSGAANMPALTGTLFTFDVNGEGISDCNLTIAKNALRGGIVGEDANEITATNLPYTVKVTFAVPCTVPDCVGQTREQCLALIAALTPTQTVTESNVPGTGQPLRQVIAQSPAAGAACTGTISFSAVSWPVKPGASFMTNWLARGRPACWAYPRQCRGDVDGKKQLSYWVGSSDLTYFRSALNKLESLLPPIPGGICADFTHSKQLSYWVGSSDLTIMRSYNNKLESLVPMCGNVLNPSTDPNYHYWCLPSAGATCPTGQYCAPVGVCPNSL